MGRNKLLVSFLLLGLVLAACQKKTKTNHKPEQNEHKIIQKEAAMNLQEKLGAIVELKGTAYDAKSGAMILLEDQSAVFLAGMWEWPAEFFKKEVKVKGLLTRKKLAPDPVVDEKGAVSTGAFGSDYVLEKYTYQLVK